MLRICAWLLLMTAVPAIAAPTPLQTAIGDPGWLHLSANVRTRIESIDDQIRPGFMANEDLLSLRSVIRVEIGSGPLRLVGESSRVVYACRPYVYTDLRRRSTSRRTRSRSWRPARC